MKTTLQILPKSQAEIKVVIPAQMIAVKCEAVYQKLASTVNIPGFRAGKAPRNLIEGKLGQEKILQETLDDLLFETYREAVKEHDLHPITYPQFKIEKLEKDKDVEVAIQIHLRPNPKVGDYQKIKAKKAHATVTEADVKKVLDSAFEKWKKEKSGGLETPKIEVASTLSEAASKTTQTQQVTFEDFIKQTGAKSESELMAQIKQELEKQAEIKTEADFENSILDQLDKMTEIDLPEILVEQELDSMLKSLETQLVPLKMKLDDYLKQINKTSETIKGEWRKSAEKRVRLEFALTEVTQSENILVTDEELNKTISAVLDEHLRSELEKPEQKVYIKYSLQREKTIQKLKEIAEKS